MTKTVNISVTIDEYGDIDRASLAAELAKAGREPGMRPRNVDLGEKVVLPVVRGPDGQIVASSMIQELEKQVGGSFRITDWVDLDMMAEDYPHLSPQEATEALACIDIGDYDDAINRDVRRTALDEAVERAGFQTYKEDDEDAAGDEEDVASPGPL